MSELDVLVLGGGISGLSIANRLADCGLSVEVWESNARTGGKIQTLHHDGYLLENGPSMVMNMRSELTGFLRSTGLESRILSRPPNSERYLLDSDRLHKVPTSISGLLTSPLISLAGKLRLLKEPLIATGVDRSETVGEFVTRRLGHEFLEKLFEPYLAGPLASNADLAEASTTMPALTALEQKYGSLALGAILKKLRSRGNTARPQVFSFRGGLTTLAQTLSVEGGFSIRQSIRASELWPVSGGWMSRGVDKLGNSAQTLFCKHIVVCTPAHNAAELLTGLDQQLAKLLSTIEYAPIKIVHTGFNRSDVDHALDGSGFLVPRSSHFQINGCQWMSSLFPHRAPPGKVLLSNYLGGARNPAAMHWDRNQTLQRLMPVLNRLLGIRNDPCMFNVKTHSQALPLYHGAYSQRLDAISQRVARFPGLYLEGNYKGGVSIRDRILCAEAVTKRILASRERQAVKAISLTGALPHNYPAIPASISGVVNG